MLNVAVACFVLFLGGRTMARETRLGAVRVRHAEGKPPEWIQSKFDSKPMRPALAGIALCWTGPELRSGRTMAACQSGGGGARWPPFGTDRRRVGEAAQTAAGWLVCSARLGSAPPSICLCTQPRLGLFAGRDVAAAAEIGPIMNKLGFSITRKPGQRDRRSHVGSPGLAGADWGRSRAGPSARECAAAASCQRGLRPPSSSRGN